MSARAWEARRLRRRLEAALRHLRRDPEATVRIARGVVVVSSERYHRLVGLASLVDPPTPPEESGCYGWPRTCCHFDDLECFEAEVAARNQVAP